MYRKDVNERSPMRVFEKSIHGEYAHGNPTGRWTWWKEDGRVAQSADLSHSEGVVIDTPKGPYRVWVKRTGNNPRLRVLLLHGGPGATHEYLEACDSYLPGAGIEYYYYDQLGSGNSDRPDEPLA